MTASLSSLAQGVYRVRAGLDPAMFRVANRWSLDLSKGASDAQRGSNTLLQVADLFKNNKELAGNQQAKLNILEALHIDPRMLFLLDQGVEKMRDLMAETKRHGELTDTQIAQAFALQHAYAGLTQSLGGLSNAIGAEMSVALTLMLLKMSEWIDKLRETPGALDAVKTGVEVLGAAIGLSLTGAIIRLMARLLKLGSTKIFGALTLGELFTSPGFSIFPEKKTDEQLRKEREESGKGIEPDWLQQHFNRAWDWLGLPHAGGPRAPSRTGPASENDRNYNFGNMRAQGGGWQTFGSAEEGVQATAANLRDYQNKGFNTVRKIVTRWAPPNENDTEKMISQATALMGVGENEPLDLANAETLRKMTEAMIRGEHGGALPRGASQGVISRALGGYGMGGGAAAVDSMLRLSGLGAASPAVKSFLKSGGAGLDPSSAAWCAAFVNSSLAMQGIAGSGTNVATSFEKWGGGVSAEQMRRGDVMVEPRGLGPGQQGGHVGMATGRTQVNPDTGETELEMISGNRSGGHDVGTDWVPESQTMIRRAPAVPTAATPAEGATPGPQSWNLNSSHHVVLDIRGAPKGARTEMAKAEGPATTEVRVQYSMDNLS